MHDGHINSILQTNAGNQLTQYGRPGHEGCSADRLTVSSLYLLCMY